MSEVLRFIGINKDTKTAGPGKRLEFFTKGCIRGVINPCIGCFNEVSWTFEGLYRALTVEEVVEVAVKDAWNRQVTFCGGEPILQARLLAKVAKRLKEMDPTFHIVMYTAYKLDVLMKYGLNFTWVKEKHGLGMYDALLSYSNHSEVLETSIDEEGDSYSSRIKFTILTPEDIKELMTYVDIIVDGDYQHDKRLTTSKYMHEGWFIGSSNQRVIYTQKSIMEDDFIYVPAQKYNELRMQLTLCDTCGHENHRDHSAFCSDLCEGRYKLRKEEMKLMGGV